MKTSIHQIYLKTKSFTCLFDLVLHHADTVKFVWQRSSFIGGGRHRVHFRALFKARTDTRVKPPTFCKLAGKLFRMKLFPVGIRIHISEGQVFWSQQPLPLGHGRPRILNINIKLSALKFIKKRNTCVSQLSLKYQTVQVKHQQWQVTTTVTAKSIHMSIKEF
jgi:hypothetical protein